MDVSLRITGGFAAIRRPDRRVDTAALSPEEQAELTGLVERACAAAAPPARSVPDGMTYTITVGTEPEATVLTGGDGTMSPEFRALLDWVRRSAR